MNRFPPIIKGRISPSGVKKRNGRMEEIGTWKMDTCIVELSTESGRLHLSIRNPRRYPTLDEVKAARDKFLPKDLFFAQVLIGTTWNCFDLWEIRDKQLIEIFRPSSER